MICENNIKYLVTGISILFWFKGMYRILDKFIPDTMFNNIFLVILSLTLLFLNEGTLKILGSENKQPENNKKNN